MSFVSIKLVQTLLAISIIHLRMEVLQLKKKKKVLLVTALANTKYLQ
jgi:hypothetical protein